MKKGNYKGITFNVPLLSLSFISAFSTGSILIRSKLPFLAIIGWILMIIGFFICLFMVFSCFYYFYKIMTSKCCFCNKPLEDRRRKAINFMLTPPWKKRRAKFICQNCQMLAKKSSKKNPLLCKETKNSNWIHPNPSKTSKNQSKS